MAISDAVRRLHQANDGVRTAISKIDEHVGESDYNDMASLIANAASALIQATVHLLEERDEAAFDMLEQADDFLDSAMDIVDVEDEDEDLGLTPEEGLEELRDDKD